MEIGRIRKELTELIDNITEHSNKYTGQRTIPSLEVGVVLTKINRLQEGMAVLRHLLEEQEIKAKEERKNYRTNEPAPRREKTENVQIIAQQEAVEPAVAAKVEEVVIQKEVVLEAINLEQPTIPKLIDALTLNDRYLYANELFNKDMHAFNELVKAIDGCSSFDEAQKLYVSLDWEIENEYVLSFTNLVERRFS
jgi:hypothetical protein